jgi:hypothetical protein
VSIFYPEDFNKDSITKILRLNHNKEILNIITENNIKDIRVVINDVSSNAKIRGRYLKIINITETFTFEKENNQLYVEDLKSYLHENLIHYIENDTSFTINKDTNLIAIYGKGSWEYFDFNISIFYNAYGLQDSKKLVNLCYEDIFVPAAEKWEVQSIADFKEIYSENKDLPQYKNLDFDAYCDCLIRHEEKLDPEKTLETNYYESETHLNNIYRCRILTTHE